MYNIYRAVKDGVKSNSWVLACGNECVLIDTNMNVIELLHDKKLTPLYIFLTHEHYDHCEGLDIIRDEYNAQVIASVNANKSIVNAKKNMSIYSDGKGFTTREADIVISENCHFEMLDTTFFCIIAKGHSVGGIIIKESNNVFTGDTVLKNIKTPTCLPTGSKKDLLVTLTALEMFVNRDTVFYPGHGNLFASNDWNKADCL